MNAFATYEIVVTHFKTFHHVEYPVRMLIGYNVHMQFEVPQFIEIEDKIIGPLTWRQFIYLAGGGGILIILYLTVPFIFIIIIGLPFMALAVALAFHKVNNRPLSIFLESSINYLTKTKLYLWKREEAQAIIEKTETVSPTHDLSFAQKKSINTLSRKLTLNQTEQ